MAIIPEQVQKKRPHGFIPMVAVSFAARGKELAKPAEVTAAPDQVKLCFPSPHHPWERGTNENISGLPREYFPKGKDISHIPGSYSQENFDDPNKRPRKCPGCRTPFEVYHSKSLSLA